MTDNDRSVAEAIAARLPEDCYLAYIVMHEAYWAPRTWIPNEKPTVMVQAASNGGGVGWEFEVQDYASLNAVRVGVFSDSWAAFAQIPEFFAALAAGEVSSLADVRALLDRLGAVDRTERSQVSA